MRGPFAELSHSPSRCLRRASLNSWGGILPLGRRPSLTKAIRPCMIDSTIYAVRTAVRNYPCSSRFSQHGSTLSHLNNNLLHLHMMNTTMNSQQRKTIHTDMNSMMLSLQLHNLILTPNLKPKTTSHSQNKPLSNLLESSARP